MAKLKHTTDYREHRSNAYPPSGDALDAIVKGFRSLIEQGVSLPPETVAWVDACERVKAKFRKPRQG